MITTPNDIKSLKDNEVFVFGSNIAGIHGAGAAKLALISFGAVSGMGFGHFGKSFAIPTKSAFIKTLPIYEIKEYVDHFIWYAEQNKNLIFYVTKIGCGLAGYTPDDIAPLFKDALPITNIILPIEFIKVLISAGLYDTKDIAKRYISNNIILHLTSQATSGFDNDSITSIWINGFNTHKDLTKDKLFTMEDMEYCYNTASRRGVMQEAGLEADLGFKDYINRYHKLYSNL